MDAVQNRQILIGVHVAAQVQSLNATLTSIFENTPLSFALRILPDCRDTEEATALQDYLRIHASIVLLPTAQQSGAAACFNQLVTEPADVYVFLECGVRVCPGWLELLLTALDVDGSHGLAGPSTNRGWNEQAVAPACGSSQEALWDQADTLLERFGEGACVPLEPLHSLADFCYVVKNEVVAAIGAADTAYGQGPCWEMDYNVRAARAGFRGVWAQAAFVYRESPCPQSTLPHDALMEVNKRLYQDRFCAWRIEVHPLTPPYHVHCAGEDCRYFAVPESTRIFKSLPSGVMPRRVEFVPTETPLLSCVMPTRGRPAFVAQSIRYFQRQDYPSLELIIVYEDDADLPPRIDDARIRCIRMPTKTSIGAKRNEAVRLAYGVLIAHWDDDDWYGDRRLSEQVAPILHNLADVTGLNDMLFMARPLSEFWACSRALFRRMFVENVSGGTLVFRRSMWERHGQYPNTSLREDADFLQRILRGGAQLCRISGRALCVYVRHHGNTWKFKEGQYLQQTAWTQVPMPVCLQQDHDFYFSPVLDNPAAATTPLVSCIMPTSDRRDFVPQAIRNFLAQDYGARELIVLDDGRDSVADLIPPHDSIRYLRLDRKSTIGAKRNIACELARGELIAHWDDDDWMAPGWLSSQVRALHDQGADICGLDKVFFYAPDSRRAWQYVYDGLIPWVCGGTLCYWRDFWRGSPFADINVGEDNAFVWAPRHKRIATNPDQHLYVARVHARNTSPKDILNRRWRSYPVEQIERLMQ